MSLIFNISSLSFRKNIVNFIKTGFRRTYTNVSSNVLNSDWSNVEIPKISLPEYVFSNWEKYSNFTAVECSLTGRKFTYEDLIIKSKNLSRALLKKLKLKENDVIALMLPNIPEFPIAALGCLNAGLITTTLNPVYSPEEISRQIADSSTKAIITLLEMFDKTNASCQLVKKLLPIITIRTNLVRSLPQKAIDFREFTDNVLDYPDLQPRQPEDVAFLPYSSGTTGLPKGVQLTHYNVIANICQSSSPEVSPIENTTKSHQDIIPVILPMFHIFGFTVNTLCCLTKGTKLITVSKFSAEDYGNMLRSHKPQILFVVPPLVSHPLVKPEDLESVRLLQSGAACLGALDEEKFIEKFRKSVRVVQGYGLTEASPSVSTVSIEMSLKLTTTGSTGKPLSNTSVKIINSDDPTGTPLGPNTTGELLVKGPQVMKGYLNKPEETKKTFLDGWLKTGDMAYYNKDGLLYITDRLKELIKVKSFQVAPAELEEIIRNFPNIDDAAVVGIPHPTQGEAPRAYIVPKKNTKINLKDLEEYVKNKVAHYKQLKGGIAVVDSIPKNASGKIMRQNLKKEYEKSLKK